MLPEVLLFTALAALWGIGCSAFTKECAPFARPSLPERPCCREVMLREDLRPSLPERPCCREVMLREDHRPHLPERPCRREVMLREDLRPSLPERPCRRELVVSSVLWSHAQLSKQNFWARTPHIVSRFGPLFANHPCQNVSAKRKVGIARAARLQC